MNIEPTISYDWFKTYWPENWGVANGCLWQSDCIPNIAHVHRKLN